MIYTNFSSKICLLYSVFVGSSNNTLIDFNFKNPNMQEYTQENFSSILDRTRQIFNTGKTLPIWWRKKQLKQLAKFMDECDQEIQKAVKLDLGKVKKKFGIVLHKLNNFVVQF